MNVLYVIYSIKGYISLLYIKIALQWQIMIASFSCQITSWIGKIAPIAALSCYFRKLSLNSCCFSLFLFPACLLYSECQWLADIFGSLGDQEEESTFPLSQSPKLMPPLSLHPQPKIIEINVIFPWNCSWF